METIVSDQKRYRGLIHRGTPDKNWILGWPTFEVWVRVNDFKEVFVGRIYQTYKYVFELDPVSKEHIVKREGEGYWYVEHFSDRIKTRDRATEICYQLWVDRRKGKEEEW